jgi:hypothetical protein
MTSMRNYGSALVASKQEGVLLCVKNKAYYDANYGYHLPRGPRHLARLEEGPGRFYEENRKESTRWKV